MTATPPEANTEYSRASRASRGSEGGGRAALRGPQILVLVAGMVGAVLLLAAELSTLYQLHLTTATYPVQSVSTGSHNSYAMIPIALLGSVLAVAAWRQGGRAVALALVALGVVALLIALIGDLPDTRARGIAHEIVLASTSAGPGIYLETLGAVALILAGGIAFVLSMPEGLRLRARPAP